MNKWIKIWMIPVLFLFVSPVQAQQGLSIDTVFSKYDKMKGSTFISLAKDVLGDNTRILRYKCLIIKSNPEATDEIEAAVQRDKSGKYRGADTAILKEVKKDGKIQTASYLIERKEPSSYYEYILYTRKDGNLTLIYILGRFPKEQLEYELKLLKNLFIQIKH